MKDYKGLILMFIVFLFTVCYISFTSAGLVEKTLNFYNMNYASGNAIDSTYRNNLTAYGTIQYNQTGIVSYATGTLSSGTTPNANHFKGSTTDWNEDNMSFSFWFKKNSYGDGAYGFIGNSQPLDSKAGIRIILNAGNLTAQVNDNTYISGATYYIDSYNDTGWHHAVIVFSDPDVKMWIDGINVNNGTWDGRSIIENTTFYIHSDFSGAGGTGNYSMDAVGIFNSTLNSSEIQLLYSADGREYPYDNRYAINSNNYSSDLYETETGDTIYTLNLTPSGIYAPTNAYFNINSISYPVTVYNFTSYYILNKTLSKSSLNTGNNYFGYTFNLSSTSSVTLNYSQSKASILFGLCNATLTVPYLNLTFKDETDNSWINASVPSSTFEYYLGDGSVTKTYTYSETVNKSTFQFCTLPANRTYYVDSYFQYKLGDTYPQRTWNPELATYTNSTTNQTLYLLSTTDGIDVTFQVLNIAGQTISGVNVNAYKVSGSTTTFVMSGTTSSSGSVTFYLNSNYEHIVNFSKTGYTTFTFDEPPTQSTYTITLASSSASGNATTDYRRGISVSKTPLNSSLDEQTVNDFTLNISSSYHSLDNMSGSLYFGNDTLISTIWSTDSEGDTLTWSNINITNQSIYMTYNFTINSSTISGNYYWMNSGTEGREFSITNLITDINTYTSTNLLGIDNFGRGILAILFLLLIAGGMSYRYGIGSEPMILGTIFGIVLFLDSMNFIPKPDFLGIVPLDNFLSIITGILFIGFILKEELR